MKACVEKRGLSFFVIVNPHGFCEGLVMINVNSNTVSIDGLSEFEKKLKQLQTDSPGFERRLRGVIKKVLGEARANLRNDAATGLRMESDPRHAYKAVRFAVYKRIFGGQVNILDAKRGTATETSYRKPRKLRPGQRGGNRRPVSVESKDKYEGAARGFILRFLNAGTKVRYSGYGRNGRNDEEYESYILRTGGLGHRGQIAARNWFGPASQAELERVAGQMQQLIDKIINDEFV